MNVVQWLSSTITNTLTKIINLCPLVQISGLTINEWKPCIKNAQISTSHLQKLLPIKVNDLHIGALRVDLLKRTITVESVRCCTDLSISTDTVKLRNIYLPDLVTDFVKWLNCSIQIDDIDLTLLNGFDY